jgi:hypothetical protein
MKINDYESIIKQLNRFKPAPVSASDLTDRIMHKIENLDNPGLFILKVNKKQWTLFNGLRVLLTTAAVFLIAFFCFQQWQILSKIDKMESQITVVQNKTYQTDRLVSLQKAYYLSKTNIVLSDTLSTDLLQINRKSLNFLIKKIELLESENSTIREKIQKYYNDSINKELK